jgi:hypothetical protein
LIKSTGFFISYGDVVVFDFNFRPAQTGVANNPQGVKGYFEFRVSPASVNNSAYADGVITATAYDLTGNILVGAGHVLPLQAWSQNGVLHVTGLTPGKVWNVYNLYGRLIYTGIAVDVMANIPLPSKGIYIIMNDKESIKTVIP